ncbi:MAG: LysE family transporter [Pseudomonadota bacterium]
MIESLALLCGAALAALGSPGPAPIALAGIGASFGPAKGIPFFIGVLIGLSGVVALTAAGVGTLLVQGGPVVIGLLVISVCYFVFIAFKIATAPITVSATNSHIPTLKDGIILNLTNPKAYAALAALYAGFRLPIEPSALAITLTGFVALLVAMVINFAWLFAGGLLVPAFAHPKLGRPLRLSLAGLMLLAVGTSIWIAAR